MDQIDYIKQPKVPAVTLCSTPTRPSGDSDKGMLWLSAYHIIFADKENNELQIVYSAISRVTMHSFGDQGAMLAVELKTFRRIFFYIPVVSHANNVIDTIKQLKCPHFMKWLPAYKPEDDANLKGWDLFDMLREYERMGFVGESARNDTWRLTTMNNELRKCTSYPRHLVVPNKVDDDVIEEVFKHRELGRIPVAVYRDSIKDAVLVRCGQPRTQKGKTCYQDAQLLRNIQAACEGRSGFIFDTRTAAVANKNGGSEPTARGQPYSSWKMMNIGLKTVRDLQMSFDKLLDACSDCSMDASVFWGKVESSGWLYQIRMCLFAAVAGAKQIREEGNPVVVHGTSGYDNTSIITSLIQLLLDPFFRTIKGFVRVIEKEWLWMGHPFSSRHQQYYMNPMGVQSPVFLLFLDCVHQCIKQFPYCFEFDDALLFDLHSASQDCEYGTFMFDTQLEREAQAKSKHFKSFWPTVLEDEGADKYTNPFYNPTCEVSKSWLHLSFRPQVVALWEEMYCWHSTKQRHPLAVRRESVHDEAKRERDIGEEVEKVLKELNAFEKEKGLKQTSIGSAITSHLSQAQHQTQHHGTARTPPSSTTTTTSSHQPTTKSPLESTSSQPEPTSTTVSDSTNSTHTPAKASSVKSPRKSSSSSSSMTLLPSKKVARKAVKDKGLFDDDDDVDVFEVGAARAQRNSSTASLNNTSNGIGQERVCDDEVNDGNVSHHTVRESGPQPLLSAKSSLFEDDEEDEEDDEDEGGIVMK
eukprot:m.134361 g.134361  ORF g.134361 m.134361 type:complete len:752 (-) comp13113_c2_seq2:139-2394(-)